jgi:hypothetical protein
MDKAKTLTAWRIALTTVASIAQVNPLKYIVLIDPRKIARDDDALI